MKKIGYSKMSNLFSCLFILLALIVFCELSYAAPEYEIIQIYIPGSEFARARAINDTTEVVGNFRNNSTGNYVAFYWKNGNYTILDKPSSFIDINNKSQIVGSLYNETEDTYVPIMYENNNKIIYLSMHGGSYGFARAINNSSQIVGALRIEDTMNAVLWEDNVVTMIYTEENGAEAWHINDLAQILISNSRLWGYGFKVLKKDKTILFDLSGVWATGYQINNHEQIAGMTYVIPDTESVDIPCIWEFNGNRTDVMYLDAPFGWALGINDNSQLVGFIETEHGNTQDVRIAFLWDKAKLYDLNDLIPPDTGWVLNEARDINNKGEIVGWGYLDDVESSFLLIPKKKNK